MLARVGVTVAAMAALLIPILLPTVIATGCAPAAREPRAAPAPRFARPQGPWKAEELNRDLIACLDRAHPELAAELAAFRGPPAAVRKALRDRISQCMANKGWVGR